MLHQIDGFEVLLKIAMIGFSVFLIIFIYVMLTTHAVCRESSKIISIGGCGRYGTCGVRLENDQFVTAKLPVIGQEFCLKEGRE